MSTVRWAQEAIQAAVVVIFGSRDFADYTQFCAELNRRLPCAPKLVISGGAGGADTMAARFCTERGYLFQEIPARWEIFTSGCRRKINRWGQEYNADAGHVRNAAMAAQATHGIGFWDGHSPGTRHMIKCCRAANLELDVILVGKEVTL